MVCETSGVKTYETPNFPYALPLSPNTPQIPYFSHSSPQHIPETLKSQHHLSASRLSGRAGGEPGRYRKRYRLRV